MHTPGIPALPLSPLRPVNPGGPAGLEPRSPLTPGLPEAERFSVTLCKGNHFGGSDRIYKH